jgi:maltokinase
MIAAETLAERLPAYLPKQRWYAGEEEPSPVEIERVETVREPWPAIVQALLLVDGPGGPVRYQVLLGLRPAGEPTPFLDGHPDAALGELATDAGPAYAYDAMLDPELTLALLDVVAPEAGGASHVRFFAGEQSNTSVAYDDRLMLKLFRRVVDGPNPEVEVPMALAGVGFPSVAEPVAAWEEGDLDFAVVQAFMVGGVEGWSMALTSLRDLFGEHLTRPGEPDEPEPDPGEVGGDFAAEARRLGVVTAELHAAMATAFGRAPGDAGVWADGMEEQLRRVRHKGLPRDAIRDLFATLRWVSDPGPAIRVHGDYHLAQVMRTDAGWYVLDFEGEPARPLDERRAPTSPLKDVAGMLRSLHYAWRVAQLERSEEVPELGAAWEQRNREAFLDGYVPAAQAAGLLPAEPGSFEIVLAAFELEKALYEVAYEQDHRPDWVAIPLAAIERLLGEGVKNA